MLVDAMVGVRSRTSQAPSFQTLSRYPHHATLLSIISLCSHTQQCWQRHVTPLHDPFHLSDTASRVSQKSNTKGPIVKMLQKYVLSAAHATSSSLMVL